MCFSAQASFIAGIGLSFMGFLSIRKVKDTHTLWFALTPFLFAVQQIAEGTIWMGIHSGNVDQWLYKIATLVFLFFAGIVWPLWVPFSLYMIERKPLRQKYLKIAFGCGVISAFISFILWLYMGIEPRLLDQHISYFFIIDRLSALALRILSMIGLLFYTVATIGSFFISSVPKMWMLGVLVGGGFIVAHLFYYMSFGSVWCFFAAIASGMVYYILDRYNKHMH